MFNPPRKEELILESMKHSPLHGSFARRSETTRGAPASGDRGAPRGDERFGQGHRAAERGTERSEGVSFMEEQRVGCFELS